MSRWTRAPTWSASCSFRRSPRNLGARGGARARRTRVQGPRAARSRSRSMPTTTTLADIVEALKPDMLQLHGKETPERVVDGAHALRPAGDEGAADRRAAPISSPIRLYDKVADRLLFDARAPREATRPGGLGKPFDWTLLENLDAEVPFMLSGGLDAGNVAEALRITRAPGVDVSSGVERAPGEKDPDKIRAFIARRARWPTTRARERSRARMTVAAAQFVPHRPRRARAFRHLRRPLRRRDADAADPRAGAGLRRGQGRSGVQGARWTAISTHYVGRPSPLYFAERLTAHFGGAQDLFQARGAQPHRRAQGEQRARPDPAGQAHGQDRASSPRPAPACTASRPRRCAPSSACACVVYMGAVDVERQQPNVLRMQAARRRGAAGRVRLAARSRTR